RVRASKRALRHRRESISISSSIAGDSLRIALARTSTIQDIRASGCARLRAATAGRVWTTSPIELSFTTRILITAFYSVSQDYSRPPIVDGYSQTLVEVFSRGSGSWRFKARGIRQGPDCWLTLASCCVDSA